MLQSNAPFVGMPSSLEWTQLPTGIINTISFQAKMALRLSSWERSEPCCLPFLLEVVAQFLGRNPQEVAHVVRVTSRSFFALPLSDDNIQ